MEKRRSSASTISIAATSESRTSFPRSARGFGAFNECRRAAARRGEFRPFAAAQRPGCPVSRERGEPMTGADLGALELRAAPLGHPSGHPDHYAPALLFAVPRAPQRAALGIGAELPFTGSDVWTAYELTWLDPAGKPQV